MVAITTDNILNSLMKVRYFQKILKFLVEVKHDSHTQAMALVDFINIEGNRERSTPSAFIQICIAGQYHT